MTNKARYLVFMLTGLLLLALAVRNGRLLSLAIPFLIYFVVGMLQAPTEVSLSARRTMDAVNAVAQAPVQAHLVVQNEGGALGNLLLDDVLSSAVRVLEGQAGRRLSLPAGGVINLDYVLQAPRGLYAWTALHASASDPFGLFEVNQEVPAFGEILVRPAPMQLRHIPIEPRLTLHAPGPVSSRLAGSGIDFFGIREYRPGDSLRRVNWRLAARHPGARFTNEFEREEIADFGLILDARKFTSSEAMEQALFESSVSAAASLAEIFLKEGNRVAFLMFGKGMTFSFPGYGKRQLHQIVRNLACARLGPQLSLRYLEHFTARLFPSRSILVILSQLGLHDLETYARLRGRGHEILLISPDPVHYVSQTLLPTQINDWAVRTARIERHIELKRLMKLGVKVVDWQVDQPLKVVLQTAARYLAQRGNL